MNVKIIPHSCALCDKPIHARGYCNKHYHRLKRQGLLWFDKNYHSRTPEEKFWGKVQKADGCWLWSGDTDKDGYGRIYIDKKYIRAHRFSWELHNGPIPPGLFIIHSCDRCGCVNPEHLRPGTAKDNAGDMISRNRNRIGEDRYQAKLKETEVIDIMNRGRVGENQQIIAEQYGIKQPQVSAIKLGKTWQHITAV